MRDIRYQSKLTWEEKSTNADIRKHIKDTTQYKNEHLHWKFVFFVMSLKFLLVSEYVDLASQINLHMSYPILSYSNNLNTFNQFTMRNQKLK